MLFFHYKLKYCSCSLKYYQIGTDIEDFKCSWLVVQALERADENEKKILSVRASVFPSPMTYLLMVKMDTRFSYILYLLSGELWETGFRACC